MATFGFRYLEGPVDKMEYPEGSTQSFKVGDPVELSAGQLIIASDDQSILGIAEKDASGTAGTMIPVHIIHPDQLWTVQADTTTTQAMEGLAYGLNISAGNCSVDLGDTTTTTVVVKQLDPQDGPHTNAGGKLIVRFKPDVCAAIGG